MCVLYVCVCLCACVYIGYDEVGVKLVSGRREAFTTTTAAVRGSDFGYK